MRVSYVRRLSTQLERRANRALVVRPWSFAFVPACVLVSLEACDRARHDPAAEGAATTAADVDAASASGADGGPVEKAAGRRLVMKLAAASFIASVSDTPEWPENDAGARRLGYL